MATVEVGRVTCPRAKSRPKTRPSLLLHAMTAAAKHDGHSLRAVAQTPSNTWPLALDDHRSPTPFRPRAGHAQNLPQASASSCLLECHRRSNPLQPATSSVHLGTQIPVALSSPTWSWAPLPAAHSHAALSTLSMARFEFPPTASSTARLDLDPQNAPIGPSAWAGAPTWRAWLLSRPTWPPATTSSLIASGPLCSGRFAGPS